MPAIAAGILSYLYLADRPRDAKWLRADEREWLAGELEREHAGKGPRARMRLIDALRHRDVILLALAYFGSTCGTYGLGLWMPKIIQKLGSLSVVKAALLAGIPAIAAIPAMLLNGWHSDRTGERLWHTGDSPDHRRRGVGRDRDIPRQRAGDSCAAGARPRGDLRRVPAAVVDSQQLPWPDRGCGSIGLINSFGNLGGFLGPYLIGRFSQGSGDFTGGMWFVSIAALSSGLFVLLVRKRPV